MTWTSIFIAGILTYFTRMSMVTLIRKEMISDNLRKILNYVPSVVFPSIIFPEILLMGRLQMVHNLKSFLNYH